MPGYASLPDIARMLRDHESRIKILEVQMAYRSPQGGSNPGYSYDANVLSNGGFESGLSGWYTGFWHGTVGSLSVETADPLDEQRSLKMSENALCDSEVWWRPSQYTVQVGVDCFATAPGDVWRLSGLIRGDVDLTAPTLYGVCGTTAADCFGVMGDQTYVSAASFPITANTVTAMSGTITVPAGRNYIAFAAYGDYSSSHDSPWQWWIDDAVLQQRL